MLCWQHVWTLSIRTTGPPHSPTRKTYGGWLDKFPLGAAFAKGLTLKMGQTHMHKYMPILLERIERGEIDPSFIITHRIGLEDAPTMYRTFRDKQDACIKVVMKPGAATPHHTDR